MRPKLPCIVQFPSPYDRPDIGFSEVGRGGEAPAACPPSNATSKIAQEWNFAQKEGSKFVIFRVFNAARNDVELVSITNPFRQWKDMNIGMCISL